jgi:hypothetical protein
MICRILKSAACGAVVGAALLMASGCGPGRLGAPVGEPVADPAGFAEELRSHTLPNSPQQVTFGWTLDEAGSRPRGRGVVRYEAPQRIRLDLFGPRGETYLVAALVGTEYRLPPEAERAATLPSPSLLWSALGVLEPPPGTSLSAAAMRNGEAELRYEGEGSEVFAYTFALVEGERPLLRRVERAGRQGIVETVHVERDATGAISRTRYRNWSEYRELTLDIEGARDEASFPPNIWRPDAASH